MLNRTFAVDWKLDGMKPGIELRARRIVCCASAAKALISLLLLALVSGCAVPILFSGYAPQGSEPLEGGRCVIGVNDILRIPADDGVSVTVRAGQHATTNTITLNIEVLVSDRVSARFLSPVISLTSTEWAQPIPLLIDRISGGEARDNSPTAVLRGTPNDTYNSFLLWFVKGEKGTLFQTMVPKTPRFTLALPTLQINGRDFVFSPISFEEYKKWGLGFLCT